MVTQSLVCIQSVMTGKLGWDSISTPMHRAITACSPRDTSISLVKRNEQEESFWECTPCSEHHQLNSTTYSYSTTMLWQDYDSVGEAHSILRQSSTMTSRNHQPFWSQISHELSTSLSIKLAPAPQCVFTTIILLSTLQFMLTCTYVITLAGWTCRGGRQDKIHVPH